MKLETFKIHKTNSAASLIPCLGSAENNARKNVAFYIRGEYFAAQEANNLYNRRDASLPPRLPNAPLRRIMENDFENGDIPCYVIDRGIDIEIIVE